MHTGLLFFSAKGAMKSATMSVGTSRIYSLAGAKPFWHAICFKSDESIKNRLISTAEINKKIIYNIKLTPLWEKSLALT